MTGVVGDDDDVTWLGREPGGECVDVVISGVLDDLNRERTQGSGVPLQRGVERIVLVTAVGEGERYLQEDQNCKDHHEVREQQAAPHEARNLNPTLRTVSI